MGKKSRKQRTQQRKQAHASAAERLDSTPAPATVALVPPPELIRHQSGFQRRVAVEHSRSSVLDSLVASKLAPSDEREVEQKQEPEPEPQLEEPAPETLPDENRVSPRVSLAVDIHLASHSHFFSGLSGDISEGGLFLSTYRSLPIGSVVDLEFSLPGSDRMLQARGKVRWVRDHSAFGPRGVGIAFDELSPQDRKRIHEFCSVRPPLYYDDLG